jgi:alanine dehydrogenase
MQMQELQLRQQDLQLKAQKQAADAAAKADQIEIEKSRIAAQKEIAAMQVGATAAAARDKAQKQQETDGVRMGVEIAKHKAQMVVQNAQRMSQQQRPQKPPKKG